MWVFLIHFFFPPIFAITIDQDASDALSLIIERFQEDPANILYQSPIHLRESFPYPCDLLFFSPMEQYQSELICPIHQTSLQLSRWTDDLSNQENRHNPRLIFCEHSNILLIQRYLYCNKNHYKHYYLSTNKDILEQIHHIERLFPYRIYRRSMFSHRLIVLLYQLLSHGMNFQAIGQVIANNHFTSHSYGQFNESFYESQLSSFPSPQKLEDIFLDVFQEFKDYFLSQINDVVPVGCLTADHTFKIGKNIGGYRSEDNKFVRDAKQLFLMMDRTHQIVAWKLVSSGKQCEIEETLCNVSNRVAGKSIDYIVVDNCCEVRNFYSGIFAGIPVKLDIFHAVQRLTKTLPGKHSAETRQIANKVGLIFRQKGDLGQRRQLETPNIHEINENIDHFLKANHDYLTALPSKSKKEFEDALKRLRVHVERGCVSGIAPSDGTEVNEGFHRLINYSCLRGVSTLGPELATAVLCVLFAAHNSKLTGTRHKSNKKITPVNAFPMAIKIFSNFKEKSMESDSGEPRDTELPANKSAQEVIIKIKTAIEILSVLKNNLIERKLKIEFLLNCKFLEVYGNNTNSFHQETLMRNCLSFGLVPKAIEKDGDCFFSAFIDQLKRFMNNEQLRRHLKDTLQLSLLQANQTADILLLRNLFVDELKKECYQHFITEPWEEVEKFRNLSIFASDTGDLVVRALSNITRIPVIVVSSSKSFQCEPFFPSDALEKNPIFLAYNSFESHYDSTQEFFVNEPDHYCSCQPKNEQTTCTPNTSYSSRCPCLRRSVSCNTKCRCKSCGNNKVVSTIALRCSCRIGSEKMLVKSCVDNIGKKSSRCPCFKANMPCGDLCLCRICGNPHGVRKAKSKAIRESRVEYIPTTYKKARTDKYLETDSSNLPQGTWTSNETITLYFLTEYARNGDSGNSVSDITELYETIRVDPSAKELGLRDKSVRQIRAKLISFFS